MWKYEGAVTWKKFEYLWSRKLIITLCAAKNQNSENTSMTTIRYGDGSIEKNIVKARQFVLYVEKIIKYNIILRLRRSAVTNTNGGAMIDRCTFRDHLSPAPYDYYNTILAIIAVYTNTPRSSPIMLRCWRWKIIVEKTRHNLTCSLRWLL